MSTPMVVIAGHVVVAAADRDRYVAGMAELVERARAADGCLEVAVTADTVDPARVLIAPAGALLSLTAARWPRLAVPLAGAGLAALAAYSVGIELTQLHLARLDRACDVTDMVDNTVGAALGVLAGGALALLVRPWRR